MERYAKKYGIDLEEAVGRLGEKLIKLGDEGDIQAIKLFFDRWCGLQTHKTELKADITARQGPPVPEARELGESIHRLAEIAEKHGLLREPAE
jgi:hypothetical protein